MADFRAELQALVDAYDKHGGRWPQEDENALCDAVERARDLLAQQEQEHPADGEVEHLAQWLDVHGDCCDGSGDENRAQRYWRAAALLRQLRPVQPVPVSERLPEAVEQALIRAECALADIAEGEAEEVDRDPLQWAEKRAADALARIRPVMRLHQISTSEWPPARAHALPLPSGEVKA